MKEIGTTGLTRRQKAAVVVRLLLAEGGDIPLASLPGDMQAALAQEMARMDLIDRSTRDAVVREFCETLDRVGLSFPGNIEGTLDILGGHLSQDTTNRLRRLAVLAGKADPWDRIVAVPIPQLRELAMSEATEIAAIMVSHLPVPKAAELFGVLPSVRARQIAYAMSLTGGTDRATLRRIGIALLQALDTLAPPETAEVSVEKVGAILNFTPTATRDEVLAGLDQDDAAFAVSVRRTIFTWTNIPQRIDKRDVVRITRVADNETLLKALAGSKGQDLETVEYILSNISGRMADTLREDMEAAGKVTVKEFETATSEIITAIRQMEADGEIFLISGEPEEEGEEDSQPQLAAS